MNSFQTESTIAAIATARGMAGVAVIRVSGPHAWEIGRRLFSKPETDFQPGRFYHGWVVDAAGEAIDEVLLLIFKGPRSFTGEDVVEIHCHGGEYLSRRILELCFEAGAEPAAAGEFTKRAFLSGRMDLTQAESVMDLIGAQGEALVRMASANLRGRSLGEYIDRMGAGVISVQSVIVASVDFPDEVDEPERGPLVAVLDGLIEKAEALEAASRRNRMVREGLKVAILGMPNSGKSSLFNALLAAERSIVTDIAGTTRDVITEDLSVGGVAVTLIDTAGIRETAHSIEMMGIERSWQAAEEAEAVLYVYDVGVGLGEEDLRILARLEQSPAQGHVVRVANKVDQAATGFIVPEGTLSVSAARGQGLAGIFGWLEQVVGGWQSEQAGEAAVSLNYRQLGCLAAVRENLEQAREDLRDAALPIDLVTVPLTEALRKLDELMGRDTAEEVLTSVFSQFCVGK